MKMNNAINQFGLVYKPVSGIVNYAAESGSNYFEYFDIDPYGRQLNHRPLSSVESLQMAECLHACTGFDEEVFLTPSVVIPDNLLYLATGAYGRAVWFTQPQQQQLFFKDNLQIPCGIYQLPGLIWDADDAGLRIFAFNHFEPQKQLTVLYHAPFFNCYADGTVCMGNTLCKFPQNCRLEQFQQLWQEYFFNSYFSHLITGHLPCEGIVSLWQDLARSGSPFPVDQLKPTTLTLKDLWP
jgi:PRTRC genetic system protein B